MKKAILVSASLLIVALLVSNYSNNFYESEADIAGRQFLRDKYLFGNSLRFVFSADLGREKTFFPWETSSAITNALFLYRTSPEREFKTDLIFVHNEAEAIYFPPNVIMAWPWVEDINFSQQFIYQINRDIRLRQDVANLLNPVSGIPMRERIYIQDFGLTYPVTMTDAINNWEMINALRIQLRRDVVFSNPAR